MADDKIRISTDALITMVVTEAEERELEQMPPIEALDEEFQPSEEFQKKMEILLQKARKQEKHKKWLNDTKKGLVSLMACISVFSCVMLPVKDVRSAVANTLIQWKDKFVAITFSTEEDKTFAPQWHITPLYIPEEFKVQDETSGDNDYFGAFSNDKGNLLTIIVLPNEEKTSFALDNEFAQYYSLEFASHTAIWGIMRDKTNVLLWSDASLAYEIIGDIDVSELIKVAEGIELYPLLK